MPRMLGETDLRPCSDMRNDLGRCQRPEPAAIGKAPAMCIAIEKTGREEIAGTGCIDHFRDRMSRHDMNLLALDDHAARLRARQGRDLAVMAHRLQRIVEIADLIKPRDRLIVRKQDVDAAADKIEKALAVALDAE